MVRNSLLFAVGLLALGCTPQPAPPVVEDPQHLNQIWSAYMAAQRELGRPPKNIAELRPQLEKLGDPERMLISPRDAQPYVIRWNVPTNVGSPDKPPLIAYEASGKDGVREVATIFGPMTMTAEEFAAVDKEPLP